MGTSEGEVLMEAGMQLSQRGPGLGAQMADLTWRGGGTGGTQATLSDRQECAGWEGSGMQPSCTPQHCCSNQEAQRMF